MIKVVGAQERKIGCRSWKKGAAPPLLMEKRSGSPAPAPYWKKERCDENILVQCYYFKKGATA